MGGRQKPFTVPVQIRYADIDSLQHVNNARYFTFMEQARTEYFAHLGLWDGRNMDKLGVILAQTSCDYQRPIRFGDQVEVTIETVRLGSKSFQMAYQIQSSQGEHYASGEATLVCFDYDREETIPIPTEWRKTLADFEGLEG